MRQRPAFEDEVKVEKHEEKKNVEEKHERHGKPPVDYKEAAANPIRAAEPTTGPAILPGDKSATKSPGNDTKLATNTTSPAELVKPAEKPDEAKGLADKIANVQLEIQKLQKE